jgi:membrane fusion protein, heavy metal efflux system
VKKTWAIVMLALALASCSRSKPEPQEKSEADEKEVIAEMLPAAQNHVGLQVAQTAVTNLKEYLQVTGTVQPIDSRIGHVRPLAKGRLQDIMVKVGDRVSKGQALARFDNIEAGELAAQYEAAQAELQKLKVQQATASRQAERSRRLAEIGAVPQKDFEAARSEEKSLDASIDGQQSVIGGISARLRRFGLTYSNLRNSSQSVIVSPFRGVIIKATAAPGEVVAEETDLFQIADLSRVWVQAEVYEKDLAKLTTGQTAFITVDTYPDQKFTGTVMYIGDILDPQTRTTRVRCEVSNPRIELKLDMFATVRLPTKFSRQGLAVPNSAIQQWEDKNFVFVQTAPTKFMAREVGLGKVINNETEVVSGLRSGEPIVVNGSFHLKSIVRSKQLGEE